MRALKLDETCHVQTSFNPVCPSNPPLTNPLKKANWERENRESLSMLHISDQTDLSLFFSSSSAMATDVSNHWSLWVTSSTLVVFALGVTDSLPLWAYLSSPRSLFLLRFINYTGSKPFESLYRSLIITLIIQSDESQIWLPLQRSHYDWLTGR